MHLEYNRNTERFVFRCTYDERFTAKSMGFWWDRDRKEWWCPKDKWYQADGLSRYADMSAKAQLDELKNGFADESVEASYKNVSSVDIPAPEGLKYLAYQACGIEFAYNHKNCLIADEMGLGKTVQALGLINFIPEIRKVLIIVPASLKLNWYQESSKWLVDKRLTIGVAHGDKFPNTNIVIINYDIVFKFHEVLLDINWDLVICDESHYLKSGKTRRTKCVLEIQGDRNIWLTGTPVMNRPEEIWTTCKALDADNWNWLQFKARYIYSQHLQELQYRLRKRFMIRRLKADVLRDLPPKTRQIIEIPAPDSVSKAEKEIWGRISNTFGATGTVEFSDAVNKLQRMHGPLWDELSKVRIETALAKLPQIKEHIDDILSEGHKAIVFAHHHKVLDELQRLFPYNSVVLHGETKIEDKNLAVNSFQKDPRIKVFIGGIRSAGFGLTLTASHYVIFAELDFTPAVMTQCEDRAHRIGQHQPLNIYHYVLEGSFDSKMARVLLEKQKLIDASLSTSENIAQTPYRSESYEPIPHYLEKPNPDNILAIHESNGTDNWVCSPLRLPGFEG